MRIIGVDLHARQQTIAMFYKRRCQEKHFCAERRPSECSPRHRAPVAYEEVFRFCSGFVSHQLGSREVARLLVFAILAVSSS